MSLLYFTSFIILSHTECITHFILLAFCLSQPPELQPLDKYNFDIYNVKCLYVACSLEHMGIHHTSLAFVPLGKAAIDPPAQLCLFRLHCCLPSCSLLVLRDVTEKMKPSFFYSFSLTVWKSPCAILLLSEQQDCHFFSALRDTVERKLISQIHNN